MIHMRDMKARKPLKTLRPWAENLLLVIAYLFVSGTIAYVFTRL